MAFLTHETEGQCCAVGGSASSGGGGVAQRPGSPRGSAQSRCVTLLGKPLEGDGSRGRHSGFGGEASARPTGAPLRATEGALVGLAVAGAASPWLCQPALDAASGGASDPGPLRGKLSPGPRLEDLAGLRLERAEAGAAGGGGGGRGDPAGG